jgi:hypothetical protein
MNQSQSHGFVWENEIREKVFELGKCNNNTDKYDIESKDNKLDKNENISIKTSKTKNIDCGDIIRFYNYDFQQKNTIILIKYRQKGEFKEIEEIMEIDYNKELHNHLFGLVTIEKLKELNEMVKNVPHGKIDKDLHKIIFNYKNTLEKENKMNIKISIKIDSKNQRRIQCSISNFDLLFNKFPCFIKNRNVGSILRGICICNCIYSLPRKRNKNI